MKNKTYLPLACLIVTKVMVWSFLGLFTTVYAGEEGIIPVLSTAKPEYTLKNAAVLPAKGQEGRIVTVDIAAKTPQATTSNVYLCVFAAAPKSNITIDRLIVTAEPGGSYFLSIDPDTKLLSKALEVVSKENQPLGDLLLLGIPSEQISRGKLRLKINHIVNAQEGRKLRNQGRIEIAIARDGKDNEARWVLISNVLSTE